jgi:hypothetical protein
MTYAVGQRPMWALVIRLGDEAVGTPAVTVV